MRAVRLSHTTRVALGVEEAIRLFTPEGERSWVAGWAPAYPAGPPEGDGDAPDTVFVMQGTTWVVTGRGDLERAYARVTPGESAGTVTVRCSPDGEATAVEVTYALTALSAAGEAHLEELADGFDAHIDGWARAIADALLP